MGLGNRHGGEGRQSVDDRAVKAMDAKETLRRSKMTRLEILQEHAETKACTCPTPGACYVMLKDALAKNNVDGPFQKKIAAILRTGMLFR